MSEKKSSTGKIWACVIVALLLGLLAVIALPGLLSSNCVIEGALVSTPSGDRPIEDLQVGDEVLCASSDGVLHPGRITQVHVAWVTGYLEIQPESGRPLRVTQEHPVRSGAEWILAGELETGESLRAVEGDLRVGAIRRRTGIVRAYDLEIEPHANFFASGILVHNKSAPETNAAARLRTFMHAQYEFRANDPDGNKVSDFWVGDVAELYFMKGGDGEEIKLISYPVAMTDPAPLVKRPGSEAYDDYLYRFAVIPLKADGTPYHTGNHRSVSGFAFCAFPSREDRSRKTIIINEEAYIYKKDVGFGKRVMKWPVDPEKEGWTKLD